MIKVTAYYVIFAALVIAHGLPLLESKSHSVGEGDGDKKGVLAICPHSMR